MLAIPLGAVSNGYPSSYEGNRRVHARHDLWMQQRSGAIVAVKRPAASNWKRGNEVTLQTFPDSFRMRIGSFRMFTVGCDY